MAVERGPYIPLGILRDNTHSARRAVHVLNNYQIQYNNMILGTACEVILGRTEEIRKKHIKSRDLLVKIDKLTEQLKDYENFKAEGRGKKGRFVVDEQKQKTLLATQEQRDKVDTDIAEMTYRLYEASR